MTNNNIIKKTNQVLEENGIYLSENLETYLDIDSLTFMSILVGIEEEFKINIPEKYLTDMATSISEMYDFIERVLDDPESKSDLSINEEFTM